MDPAIENIILGVIANGITALLAYLGTWGGKLLVGEELLQEMERRKTALDPILQRAIETVSEELDWENPEIHLFLASPEVEAIVRQIFAVKVAKEGEQPALAHIQREFQASLALYLGWHENRLVNSARVLFDALLNGCEQALNIAIDQGILSAHEAESSLRHHILLNELAVIRKNLDFLTAPQKLDLQAILEFEEKYRQQVSNRHKHITPPDFDRVRKLPVNELYVSPDFVSMPKKQGEESQRMSLTDFRNVIYRTVLLGDPGSGKSTLASKLCYDLTTRYAERLLAGRHVTPIHVTLRDYGAAKKESPSSILQFVEMTAESMYQLPPPPPGALEYILLNGRAVVIFDGLDELLDTSYRKTISADIESFCALYPSVPVLVTSRKVGYEQAPLDPVQFDVFHLAPFSDEQAEAYVQKWFSLETGLTRKQQEEKANAFMAESQVVPDLRANPLLLALMCNIYRGEGYIPKNRPDVYEKCATMLFERWDKGRGIHYVLPFEAHIRPTMMYLAHWIYVDEKRQSGVTETNLISSAAGYLHKRRFEDGDEAEHAARAFVEFCQGRAWVFTDTGTTREGERLYQFTHRTFLEYFTAAYLVRTSRTPEALMDILLPKILENEWDVVAQLAFQLQSKRLEGAGEELLTLLLKHDTSGERGLNALDFAARCLEFMVPSPRLIEAITHACVSRAITRGMADAQANDLGRKHLGAPRLLLPLLGAAAENRDTVARSLKNALEEHVNSSNDLESCLALEAGLHLPDLSGMREHRMGLWRDVSLQIYHDCSERLQSLMPKFRSLCIWALIEGEISVAELKRWYGIKSLFLGTPQITSGFVYYCPAKLLISRALLGKEDDRFAWNLQRNLIEIEHIFLSSSPPWIGVDDFAPMKRSFADYMERSFADYFDLVLHESEGIRDSVLDLGPQALFGLFGLIAVVLELDEKQQRVDGALAVIRNQQLPLFDLLRSALLARYVKVDEDEVQAELARCGFTSAQKAFVLRWVRREIDLIAEAQIIQEEALLEPPPGFEEGDGELPF